MTTPLTKAISTGRVYDFRKKLPGVKAILVDRLWPRGLRKEDLPIDLWAKDWAPSAALRKNFHEGTIDFPRFRRNYQEELQEKKQEILELLGGFPENQVLLLFAGKDPANNNATVLSDVIKGWIKEGH